MSLLTRTVITNSSLIDGVGYDPETKTLEVSFLPNANGISKVYRAHGIPAYRYESLISPGPGESTGRNFTPIKRLYFFDHVATVHPDGTVEEVDDAS